MGIDYMIAVDCTAKSKLTIEGLVDMIKARSRADAVLGLARREGDQRAPAEITFQVHLLRAGVVEKTDVSVQSLLDQAAPLAANRAGCTGCAVNRDRAAGFGCYDNIRYPIEADTERWLLGRLPDDLTAPAGMLFARAFEDFAWDGAQAAGMRTQGEMFFRLRTAPVRTWPSGLSITGDQLFHMMFHVGHLGSSHAMMLGMFFGLVAFDEASRARAQAPAEGVESDNAREMIEFLNTLAFAASRRLEILVDG